MFDLAFQLRSHMIPFMLMAPATLEIFSTAANVVTAVVACLALILAWRNLHIWRHELDGKAKWELALRLIKTVYMVKDGITLARSPFGRPSELELQARALRLQPAGQGLPDPAKLRRWTYELRWKELLTDPLGSLNSASVEARLFWEEFDQNMKPLLGCVSKLWEAFRDHASLGQDPGRLTPAQREAEQKAESIVYTTFSEDDSFGAEVETAVTETVKWLETKWRQA